VGDFDAGGDPAALRVFPGTCEGDFDRALMLAMHSAGAFLPTHFALVAESAACATLRTAAAGR
jgi:hypothetical protein